MPITEILSGPFSAERRPLRRNCILELPVPDAARRIAAWANDAGLRLESTSRLWVRLARLGRRISGVFRGPRDSSETRRIEMVLIEHVDGSSPGYDFHVVLSSRDDETVTPAEVLALNHIVTLTVVMEQRLEQLIESLQSVCEKRCPTNR